MFIRIELLGHYFELGSREPEAPQVMVIDPGGQLTTVSSESQSPYVGFYNPDGVEEEEVDHGKNYSQ